MKRSLIYATGVTLLGLCFLVPAQAEIINFSLHGLGGEGILASSELPPVSGGGSGGIMAGGVFLDTKTNEFFMDFGWGATNGFTNLSSDISLLNIHGPTASPGSGAWSESGDVVMTLEGYNPSFNSGRFTGSVTLTNSQVAELLEGRYYIHFHTDINGGGEARGYLTVAETIRPGFFEITRGDFVAGSPTELGQSDNDDVRISRSSTDVQSRTEMVITGTSATANPALMKIILEGSVFARSNVVQLIELFDFVAGSWEQIDTRNASRLTDTVAMVDVAGNVSRFVDPAGLNLQARVRYRSDNPRQQFNSNTDQFVWVIGE